MCTKNGKKEGYQSVYLSLSRSDAIDDDTDKKEKANVVVT